MFVWSNIFYDKYIILSKANSSIPCFFDYYDWNILVYCKEKK